MPPLFGVAYLVIHVFGIPAEEAWPKLLGLLVWMVGAAGFGYYSNDIFDVDSDRRSGRSNSASAHGRPLRALILLLLTALTIGPLLILNVSGWVLGLVLTHLLLFLAYSAPPLRLKERGFFGVIADGFYAHALPVMIAICVMAPNFGNFEWKLTVTLLLSWQLALGFRSILEHQLMDFDQDSKAGVSTSAQMMGKARTAKIIDTYIPRFELGFLVLFLLTLAAYRPIVGYLALVLLAVIYFTKPYGEGILTYHPNSMRILNAALSQIQEILIPLTMLMGICIRSSGYIGLAILHILVFLPGHMQLLNLGKDHVVKPAYYQGLPWVLYHGLIPLYFEVKKAILKATLWVYYRIIWPFLKICKWLYFNTVVWFFYNVIWRIVSWGWHLMHRLKNGAWHPTWKGLWNESTTR